MTLFLLIPLLVPGGEKNSKKKTSLELSLHEFSVHGLISPLLNQRNPNAPENEAIDGGLPMNSLDSDSILEFIGEVLGKEKFRGGKARMAIRGGHLVFVGEPELAKRVGTLLQKMKAALVPRVEICFKLVKAGGRHKVGTIDSKAASQLSVLYEGRGRGRAGDRICFGLRGEKVFQGQLNSEVAQESTIMDPIPRSLPQGRTFSMLALPNPSGKSFGVFGYYLDCDEGAEIITKDLSGKGLGAMEFTEQRRLKRAFSFKAASDSSTFIPLEGPGDLGLILQVKRIDPIPEMEGVLLTSLRLVGLPFGVYSDSLFGHLFRSFVDEEQNSLESFELEGWMNSYVDTDSLMDLLSATLEKDGLIVENMRGMGLFVSGAKGVAQKAGKLLDFLSKDLRRSFLVNVELQIQPMSRPKEEWRPFKKIVNLPTLSNRSILVETGREKGYLQDYGVEIAQKASIASPEQGTVFIGDRFRLFLSSEGNNVHVFLSLGRQKLLGFRRMPPACETLGPLMAPDLRKVQIRRRFSMKIGETILLGDGIPRDIEGIGLCRTRYSMTIRELD